MIVKTHKGHLFVINLAYPFGSKANELYKKSRFDLNAYSGLHRALGVLEAVQSGLYGDSTVPQMLANQYASISRTPGGKILDILAKKNLT
jgi:hypothetical protein